MSLSARLTASDSSSVVAFVTLATVTPDTKLPPVTSIPARIFAVASNTTVVDASTTPLTEVDTVGVCDDRGMF